MTPTLHANALDDLRRIVRAMRKGKGTVAEIAQAAGLPSEVVRRRLMAGSSTTPSFVPAARRYFSYVREPGQRKGRWRLTEAGRGL